MKVAFLTAGGIAPCLSSSLGHFIKTYHDKNPKIELIAYKNGYKGLLLGDYISIDDEIRKNATKLYAFGGSPIGNSRVKLTNVKDCVKILTWLVEKTNITGIFNVGTGKARTFNDLVNNVYKNMNKNTNIKYIDMPESMKDKYQYIL